MYVCSYMESCWAAALQACARGAGAGWAEGGGDAPFKSAEAAADHGLLLRSAERSR